MSLKRNIIIAIAAFVLCIALVVVAVVLPNDFAVKDETAESDQWTSGKTEDTSVLIVPYESGSYVNSKIIVQSENSFTLAKTTDAEGNVQYVVETHPTIEVIPEAINNLANNFSIVQMADTIEKAPKDLEIYGLKEPQGKYTLVNENGTATTILIGDAIGSMYYSMVEGKPEVYTIYGAYGNAVLSGINGYRETTLVDIQSGKIGEQLKRFRLDDKDGCITDIRVATEKDRVTSSTSKFVMTYPYNMPVYASKLIEIFPSFSPVNVSSFVEDNSSNLAKYGLDNPNYKLTIEDNDGKTYVVRFGNLSEDGTRVYCMMEGKNFVFDMLKSKVEAFEKVDPYVLCDRYAHLISIEDISSVQVISTDGKHNYTLSLDKNTDELFFLNGKPATDDTFRTAYRYITGIGLSADGGSNVAKTNEVVRIVFNFTDGTSYKAVYYEYDDRNYVLDQNGGISNFLVAKKSISEMYEKINAIETY